MKNLKMDEISLSCNELEQIVNTIVKKTIGRSLTDIQTKILQGIYKGKTYPALAEETIHTEQYIKNTASSLFKILNASKLLEEEVNKGNFLSIFTRYTINSQNNHQRARSTKLIIINGEISNLDEATFKALVRSLQEKGQDVTIQSINVEEGSIKITIQGTEEGLARIQKLFDSKNLETIKGFKVIEVRDLEKEEQKRLEDKSIREVDLRRADLSGTNLSWADLSGADLSGADLRGADLIQANLNEANLNEANLIQAYLREANLNKANLNKANLNKANLIQANLNEADLIQASVKDARFTNTKGIKPKQKGNLIARGAIFDDYPHNFSKKFSPK